MAERFRVALIGCGRRARLHVPGLRKNQERCEVVALADPSAEAAQAMKEALDQPKLPVYADYQEMLAKEKPDVVIACVWTALHLPVLQACVEAGVKAVHSEKPMAITLKDCRTMGQLAEASGCQLTFAHQRRLAPGNRLVRQWIREGRFGKILRMDLYSPPHLLDCGTHTFDQALSFNDETPARWVLGAIDTTEYIDYFGVKAECMACGHIVFANGVRANFQVGEPDKDMPTGVRVIGEKGFIEVAWDGEFRDGVIYSDPEWQPPKMEVDRQGIMDAMVDHIFDCLQQGEEPDISWQKALRAAEIIFALYESVRRHVRIEVPVDIDDNPFISMLESGAFPHAVPRKK